MKMKFNILKSFLQKSAKVLDCHSSENMIVQLHTCSQNSLIPNEIRKSITIMHETYNTGINLYYMK